MRRAALNAYAINEMSTEKYEMNVRRSEFIDVCLVDLPMVFVMF